MNSVNQPIVGASDYAVVNPFSGERESEFAGVSDDALAAAITTAESAYRQWARTADVSERAALLSAVADLHRDRADELAAIMVREMGKPLAQAIGEVEFTESIYRFYADNGAALLADEPIVLQGGEGSALVRTAPLGVLLGIMPWNFPLYQVARFAGPNLLIGNTILLKHAPQCPESAAALESIFTDAGFPAGAYSNLYASNQQIESVIADPRVQGVSLTGSERAGAAVAEIAGRNLKKVVLELGGSDPFILLSTDDLDATVEAAVAARLDNTGQACNAAKRFIIIDDLYDSFLQKFVSAMSAVEVADPMSPETELGPLSSEAASANLQGQVERAVTSGATLALGGTRAGTSFAPTVLVDVDEHNPAHREEFFGPVASVYRVASESEAVRIANDTPFGLGSYLFTTDPEQALRVADSIDAGMVYINIVGADSAELPFGGVKRSGYGRELGRFGVGEFANKKLIRIGA